MIRNLIGSIIILGIVLKDGFDDNIWPIFKHLTYINKSTQLRLLVVDLIGPTMVKTMISPFNYFIRFFFLLVVVTYSPTSGSGIE
jgi:hypothetical protein